MELDTEPTVAFDEVKEQLQPSALLVHFDRMKPLLVYADVSPYGVGAVLAHKMPLVLSVQQNVTTLN